MLLKDRNVRPVIHPVDLVIISLENVYHVTMDMELIQLE